MKEITEKIKKISQSIGLFTFCIILGGIVGVLIYRSYYVWDIIVSHTGHDKPVFLNVIIHDAFVLSLIFFLLFISCLHSVQKAMGIPIFLKATAIIFAIFYFIDAWMLVNIYKRLHYTHIFQYGLEYKTGLTMLGKLKPEQMSWLSVDIAALIILLIISIMTICYVFTNFNCQISIKKSRYIFMASIFFLGIGFIQQPVAVFNESVYKNIIECNIPKGYNVPYSDSYTKKLNLKDNDASESVLGYNSNKNIILLVIESLSTYHSRYFSGIHNYTPKFDTTAQSNISYTNYYANSLNTNQALVAMLLGKIPLPGFSNESLFTRYNNEESLPVHLQENGYQTIFITTGDLSFTGKRSWLKDIGFETIVGDYSQFYSDWPRYAFNAAPDEALYEYTLQQIQSLNNDKKPFFIFLETVSSHLPFVDPRGQDHTEKNVYKYVNHQLGKFYKKLQQMEYFENGILIITSDHRQMVPLDEQERDIYGRSAFYRIPLIIAGISDDSKALHIPFQQTDLYNSLRWFASKQYDKETWMGNIFPKGIQSPYCIVAPMPHDMSKVYVEHKGKRGIVLLQGDNTRMIEGTIPEQFHTKIIDIINHNRIQYQ